MTEVMGRWSRKFEKEAGRVLAEKATGEKGVRGSRGGGKSVEGVVKCT